MIGHFEPWQLLAYLKAVNFTQPGLNMSVCLFGYLCYRKQTINKDQAINDLCIEFPHLPIYRFGNSLLQQCLCESGSLLFILRAKLDIAVKIAWQKR